MPPSVEMTSDTQAVIDTLKRIHREQMAVKDTEIRRLKRIIDGIYEYLNS